MAFFETVVRGRRQVAAAFVVGALALWPAALRLPDRLEVSARILGSESAAVEEALRTRFHSPFALSEILVVTGVPGPNTEEGRRALESVVKVFQPAARVARTYSYLDRPDPYFVGTGGGTFVLLGLDPAAGRVDRQIPGLRRAADEAAAQLHAFWPALSLRLTGEGAINYDLWRTSTDDARAAERRTLPLTLLLLFGAFGAVVAALLPVVSGALAVGLAFGLLSLATGLISLSIVVVNVTSMLGLALGIDYALLAVSRFREALYAGLDAETAAAVAARQAGRTVALSGAPVAIGFLALFLVPLGELRSAAAGGLAVALVSVVVATTLLPAALAALGSRIERGRLWPRASDAETGELYRRWARRIVARPRTVLALSLPPILLLAGQAVRLSPSIPRGEWLPPTTESTEAGLDLRRMGRGGVLQSVRVILELPEDVQALSREGWEATRRLADSLGRDPRVAAVQSLRSLAGDQADDLAAIALLPSYAKRTFLSEEGDAALVELVPREGLDGRALVGLVRDLRRMSAPDLTGLAGARLRIGGLPAFGADYEDAVSGRFPGVVALVVAATLLVLFAGFRSALIPLKAVALNLLSVAGAFGALVIVFQDGYGARLLGLQGPVDGVFPIVPALVFCSVFGLSMDYEVFLVARVAESRFRGLSEDEALVEGVARTGPLITSAASVMIAVFAAFMLGSFVLMKMLGFALAVAVFLDATVIRLAIGPALLRLAGRWNWWPGGAHRPRSKT
jgi:putative drug exporter of the RND superfamily